MNQKYGPPKSTGEDDLLGSVLRENVSCTETFSAFFVKRFVLLQVKSTGQQWQLQRLFGMF